MNNSSILKNQTQDLHHNVERVMNSELLFSDQFTVEHYKNFVLKSYNYIETILNIDTEFLNEYQTILKQKKIALQTDLDHLNINQNQVVIHAVNNTNAHHHLGLVYIVLGAMLGNKLILNKLKQNQGFVNFPFAYLSQHQENLSEIWKSFQQKIDQLTPEQLDQVINGAKQGYSLFSI